MFNTEDMAQYRRLPIYRDATTEMAVDLPSETLATIGYAVNTYKYNGSNRAHVGKTAISLNVLFVVALGDVDCQLMEEISDRL